MVNKRLLLDDSISCTGLYMLTNLLRPLSVSMLLTVSLSGLSHAETTPDLQPHQIQLSPETQQTFQYYTLPTPSNPTQAIIIMHGHARNIIKTAIAGQQLSDNLSKDKPLIVIPFFAVSDDQRCSNADTPKINDQQASWTCGSWLNGGRDTKNQVSAFQAIDDVIADIIKTYPQITRVTIAGFSAGAQFTQHYVGFAHLPQQIKVRYLISDPGSWLYFSADRPVSVNTTTCPAYNNWKYGMANLPAYLQPQKDQALINYKTANITYFVGAEDNSKSKRAFYHILDKSCAANAQGNFRRDRAENYAQYDATWIKPDTPHSLIVVPHCGHQISCVFKSKTMSDYLNNTTF